MGFYVLCGSLLWSTEKEPTKTMFGSYRRVTYKLNDA
jgi:hypothetical protein